MVTNRGLIRLASGLMVPGMGEAVTAATPSVKSVDEAAHPAPSPQAPQIDGIQRSKQQAILDAPERLDPAVINVIMKSAYSFHFNRRTNTVQVYSENHAARRKKRLEEKRAQRRAGK